MAYERLRRLVGSDIGIWDRWAEGPEECAGGFDIPLFIQFLEN